MKLKRLSESKLDTKRKQLLRIEMTHGCSNRALVGFFLFDTLRYQVKSFQKIALENICFFICCLGVLRVCFDPQVPNQEFWKKP